MFDEKPLILIVDDESDSLGSLYDLLHNEGYRVLPASNSMDALDYTARKNPKIVISDLRMPGLDGIELLERIKQIAPKTRVLLLTAHGDWGLYQDVLRKGADGMLLKPSNNHEILRAVRNALEEVEQC
jgi:DNA-binding NtrC family response regulator